MLLLPDEPGTLFQMNKFVKRKTQFTPLHLPKEWRWLKEVNWQAMV